MRLLQDRNELQAGSVVMHNNHPCATPLRLMTRQGLSWDQARAQLTSCKRPRWSATPGTLSHFNTHALKAEADL